MEELQKFVDGYGLGISVRELASKAYWHMKAAGHRVWVVNERYLEVDGQTYQFRKNNKTGSWIVKAF